ncbi:MAG: DUF748 domain-containing protein [Sedimenticola sp.]
MAKGEEKVQPGNSSRRWNRILWSGVLLILLSALLLAGSPLFVERAIKGWVESSGYGKATIGQLRFNPLLGTLVLRDVEVGQQGKASLLLGEARVRLDWLPLWRKRVVVRDLSLRGVKTRLVEGEKGLQLGEIPLGGAGDEPPAEPSGWGVGLDSLTLDSSEIQIALENIDQNLAIGTLRLTDLRSWQADQAAEIRFSGRFAKSKIDIDGELYPFSETPGSNLSLKISALDLAIISSALQFDGMAFSGDLSSNSQIKVSLSEGGYEIAQQGGFKWLNGRFTQQGRTIDERELSWKGKITFAQSDKTGASVNVRGALSLLGLNGTLDEESAFQLESLTLPGLQIGVKGGGISLQHEGEVSLQGISAELAQLRLEEASIGWRGDLQAQSDAGGLKLHMDGQLNSPGTRLLLDGDETALDLRELQWRGALDLVQSTGEQPATTDLQSAGRLELAQLLVSARAGSLLGESHQLAWEGELKGGAEPINISGELTIAESFLDAPEAHYRIAAWDRLAIGNIEGAGVDSVRAGSIAMEGLLLAQKLSEGEPKADSAMLSLHSARGERFQYSREQGISLAALSPTGLVARIERDSEGHWSPSRLAEQLAQLQKGEEANESAPDSETVGLAIGGIELQGENKVFLSDAKVKPAYREEFLIEHFTLGAMDSQKPGVPSPFEGSVRIGEHSRLAFNGKLLPFAEERSGQFALEVSALEIPPLSPYGEGMLGYSLDSGQMDSEVNLSVDKGKLDGLVKLQLYKLEVSPLDSEAREQLETEMSVPLETALDLLRDDQNSIKLDLPIAGDLDNPDFDISDAINQATGKAVKKGAMTYLMTALQPFGALIAIASAAGEAASAVRLDPVMFEAGETRWKSETVEYLAKVGDVMKERPELRIRVCGSTASVDHEALLALKAETMKEKAEASGKEDAKADEETEQAAPEVVVTEEELLALADERASKVKGHLVKKHGIDAGRLISCKPAVDKEKEAKPRVDLLI